MSSPYSILDNRPIDKWKVTELKEELKRRKLTTRGLKEDLVKRLDEALRLERDNAEKSNNGVESVSQGENNTEKTPVSGGKTPVASEKIPVVGEATPIAGETTLAAAKTTPVAVEMTPIATETTPVISKTTPTGAKMTPVSIETMPAAAKATPVATETTETEDEFVKHAGNEDEKMDDFRAKVDINDPLADLNVDKVQEGYAKAEAGTTRAGDELVVHVTRVETTVTVTETKITEVESSGRDEHDAVVQKDKKELATQLDDQDSKLQLDEGLKPELKEGSHDTSAPNNQVSEVSPVSGFEVKSDCISTDSVSNNENIEQKDNIIADNVKLEHNVVKSEMVEPSSVSGESHPMDVEEPLEKEASAGDRDGNIAETADMNKRNDSVDIGDSEKLNLDRSSGDDSMEEEVDIRQIDSNNSIEVGSKSEKSEVPAAKVETPADVVGNKAAAEKGEVNESKIHPAVASEKRKLLGDGQEAVANSEPVKRQRRWNTESLKVPGAQASNSTPTPTPKSAGLRRNFSRSGSSGSGDGPKERVVPPSKEDPTNSLMINNFLRPFTLKAVQELLGKTGTVTSFWMDHIKTHCYVTYSSVEEAVETRNAVYNLQWPPNGGRLLVAEFVKPEEVKAKLEAPPTPTTPVAPPSQPTTQKQPPFEQPSSSRQQLPLPSALPPPPPLSNLPPVRERLPPPPPVPEKPEPPIVTLDDLFRKTKATPRIYYLPLSEEQVAAKLAAQGKSAM